MTARCSPYNLILTYVSYVSVFSVNVRVMAGLELRPSGIIPHFQFPFVACSVRRLCRLLHLSFLFLRLSYRVFPCTSGSWTLHTWTKHSSVNIYLKSPGDKSGSVHILAACCAAKHACVIFMCFSSDRFPVSASNSTTLPRHVIHTHDPLCMEAYFERSDSFDRLIQNIHVYISQICIQMLSLLWIRYLAI